MKIKKILGACACGACLLALCACNESGEGSKARTLADYKNVTAADSLVYYFGQLRALDFWQYTYNDTTLRTRESRDEYLRGIRAGMDAVRESDAYNQGLYVGIQMAMNLKDFSRDYDVSFNRQILLDAVADGLLNDSVVDAGVANSEFRRIMTGLDAAKDAREQEAAKAALAADAAKHHWVKINETMYAASAIPASEARLQVGDPVGILVDIYRPDGKELDHFARPAMKVGEDVPGPVTDALLHMAPKSKQTFYVPAVLLFGRFYERYGVKASDILKVDVSAGTPAEEPSAEEHPEAEG